MLVEATAAGYPFSGVRSNFISFTPPSTSHSKRGITAHVGSHLKSPSR